METFEFTIEQRKMIAQCIKHRMDYLYTVNEVYVDERKKGEIWSDEIVKAYNENCTRIGKLKTLLNYIEN